MQTGSACRRTTESIPLAVLSKHHQADECPRQELESVIPLRQRQSNRQPLIEAWHKRTARRPEVKLTTTVPDCASSSGRDTSLFQESSRLHLASLSIEERDR